MQDYFNYQQYKRESEQRLLESYTREPYYDNEDIDYVEQLKEERRYEEHLFY